MFFEFTAICPYKRTKDKKTYRACFCSLLFQILSMAKFAIHIMSTTTQRERGLNSIKEEMSEFIKKTRTQSL
jgi:hypothetical protein